MLWEVEFTDEFAQWWNSLNEDEQEDVEASVVLLRTIGPTLGRPHADLVTTSTYPNMKELRTQHEGRPYRTLFAFDPRRNRDSANWRRQDRKRSLVYRVRAAGRQDLRRTLAPD